MITSDPHHHRHYYYPHYYDYYYHGYYHCHWHYKLLTCQRPATLVLVANRAPPRLASPRL